MMERLLCVPVRVRHDTRTHTDPQTGWWGGSLWMPEPEGHHNKKEPTALTLLKHHAPQYRMRRLLMIICPTPLSLR